MTTVDSGTAARDTIGDDDAQGRKSASTVLVEIAQEMYGFGVAQGGEVFGLPRRGPRVVRLLRGGKTSLRAQLARAYFARTGRAAPQQALADAVQVIEGTAQDNDPRVLHQRVARHDGALWLDLGDATGRAARITGDDWEVTADVPVLFKRTTLNSALPEPVRGGDLAALWSWLNVTGADRALVAAWLVAVLHPEIPHPVLSLAGEQGTGKTTAEKVLVSVLDPSPVPTRKPPRDPESWVTAATGSWVVGLDNLSTVPDWLSDSLCRAVTGDGDVRRKLYTDGDMHVISFRRALILNGIDLGAVRGDLAERLIPIHLEVISETERLTETELWPRWARAHPGILGAVLDLAARVQAALPFVELDSTPRMADFARILAAVDTVLGTQGLARYRGKQGDLAAEALTGDPFTVAICETVTTTFTGTSADLLGLLPCPDGTRPAKGWPSTARQVTTLLRRQAPVMRKAGWTVTDDGGANRTNRARWTITAPQRPEMVRISASRDSRDSCPQVNGHVPRESECESHESRCESRESGEVPRLAANPSNSHPEPLVSTGHSLGASQTSLASHEYGPSLDDSATEPDTADNDDDDGTVPDQTCRDCRATTPDYILVNRDGRCITCHQRHQHRHDTA